MIKIYCHHNKRDILYSFTITHSFPNVQGKIVRIEINGNELLKLVETKDIPIHLGNNPYLVWHGKHAGRILKFLKELFLQ